MRPLCSSVGTEGPREAFQFHLDCTCHPKPEKLPDSEHRKHTANELLRQYDFDFSEDEQVVIVPLFTRSWLTPPCVYLASVSF